LRIKSSGTTGCGLLRAAEQHAYVLLHKPKAMSSCPIDLQTWQQHFTTLLGSRDTVPSLLYAHVVPDQAQSMLLEAANSPITATEVLHTVQKLCPKRASGPDCIRNEHLKVTVSLLLPIWIQIFNHCLFSNVFPETWHLSYLSVLFKGKGSPADPTAYRGIAMKSCIYKLLSSITTTRLWHFLDGQNAIPPEQHGFVPGKSTESAIAVLLSRAHSALATPCSYLHIRNICILL